MKYLPGGQPISREQLDGAFERGAKLWEDHGYDLWVVCDRATEELIGHCGLRFLDEVGETEVLYGLGRRYWGRGLATEAARAALGFGFGFDRPGLKRIVAFAVPANIASRKVMEHLGMRLEGETQLFGLDLARYAVGPDEFIAAMGDGAPASQAPGG